MKITNENMTLYLLSSEELKMIEKRGSLPDIRLDEKAFDQNVSWAINQKLKSMHRAPLEQHPWLSYWLIIVDGIGIGRIGFKDSPENVGIVDVGYGLSSNYEGCGYMTNALKLLISWAKEAPSCKGIEADAENTNIGSMRVLEKNGLRKVKSGRYISHFELIF